MWGTLTGINGVEEVGPLGRLLDIGINEQGISLRVDVFHHNLEAVEAAGLGNLNLSTEALDKVLVDDAVGSGKEGENVGDEIFLIVGKLVVPVVKILGKIDLLGGPERGLGLLVHLPDLFGNQLIWTHFYASGDVFDASNIPHDT